MEMKSADRKYLLKEAQRTLDESDSTAAFCLCQRWILKDAIALLKEQEAVPPIRIDGKRNHFIKCGNCNVDLMSSMKFCPSCGRAVKWDA
jgi:hypothetical protein